MKNEKQKRKNEKRKTKTKMKNEKHKHKLQIKKCRDLTRHKNKVTFLFSAICHTLYFSETVT